MIIRWLFATSVSCLMALALASSVCRAQAQPVNPDPLAGIPPAVDLPAMKAGEWVTLSKVAVPDNLILIFRLIGGERCLAGGRKFETKELADNRSWQCMLTGAEGTPVIEIATFRVTNGELQFSWTAAAAETPEAAMLRNTAGEFVVARTNRLVAFRKPQQAAPLTISFEETTAVYYEIPDMPRLDNVLIEIDMKSAGRGGAGNWRLLGKGPALKAHDDRWFAESLAPGNWAIKLESSYGKTLKLSATPVFWTADRSKLQPLTRQNLARAIQQLSAYESRLMARQERRDEHAPRLFTQQLLVKKKGKGKGKRIPNPQPSSLARELAGVRQVKANLLSLQQFVATNQSGSIHFRVSQDFNGFLLPLLLSR